MTIQVSSSAKCILSGEHSVLRGKPSIACPVNILKTNISFHPDQELIVLDLREKRAYETIVELSKVASTYLGTDVIDLLSGVITISSNIPYKSGLGSSAALCLSFASLLKKLNVCDDALVLAKILENNFHKRSSGLDVTVCFYEKPILFQFEKQSIFLNCNFDGVLILTDTGVRSSTRACIEQVDNIINGNPKLANEIDELMESATNLCLSALENNIYEDMKNSLTLGKQAFYEWGLVNEEVASHIETLIKLGASAAKPVGSGLGGYVVSLWNCDINVSEYIKLEF